MAPKQRRKAAAPEAAAEPVVDVDAAAGVDATDAADAAERAAASLQATDPAFVDARPEGQRGFWADVLHTMFNPGVNSNVIRFADAALLALFLSLIALGVAWEFNIHVVVLLTANVGLFFSLHWFIHELKTAAYSKESPPTAPAATAEEMAQAMAAGKRRSRKH